MAQSKTVENAGIDGMNKPVAKPESENTENLDERPGIIYVGRIPHGFYEHEMRQYFSQFGDINRLRLSRSPKTGQSKHYAFIEFKSVGVAKVVADTMNNYLIFGHLLKCKLVAPEQLHEGVWKGANKRFKVVPWNKMKGREHGMPVGRDQWMLRIEKEEKRRKSKKEKMREIGYEFDAPLLKSVEQVPIKDTIEKVEDEENSEEEQDPLVTARGEEGNDPTAVSQAVKIQKTERHSNSKPNKITMTVSKKTKRALETGEEAAEPKIKRLKKMKKTKA